MIHFGDKEDKEIMDQIVAGETATQPVLRTKKGVSVAIAALSIGLVAFSLYTAFFGAFQSLIQRPIHVFLGISLIFFYQIQKIDGASPRGKLDMAVCAAGILISLVGCLHILIHFNSIMSPFFKISSFQMLLAVLIILVVMEAARRVIGLAIPIMSCLFIAYAVFGKAVGGGWGHGGISTANLLSVLVFSDRGVWGSITGTSATIIATFVIFGSILFATGGGHTFINVANAVTGRATGGAAKLATIASALFGTVSGSAAANVATTGAFTIPMMKKLGYKPEFAAGVECAASSGGQIMPPIMGAGAFIMADLLGLPYIGIAAAAVIPALLYFYGIFFAIDCAARRYSYKGLPESELVPLKEALYYKKSLPVFIPIALLIYLFSEGYTAVTCAIYAIVAAVVLYLVVEPSEYRPRLRELYNALTDSAKGMLTTLSLIACAQILVCMISVTGIGVKFSSLIMTIGGEHMILVGFLAMIATMILGMGMPTVAAYVLAASVIAPALVRIGVAPISAHFFVFYYAIFAGLTPPVCGTVFIGAAMAEANWLKTAKYSIILSIGAFILPFMFLFSPALLLVGPVSEIIRCTVTSFMGMTAVSSGAIGYFWHRINALQRVLLIVSGLLLVIPTLGTDIVGVVLFAFALLWILLFRKKQPA